MNKVSFSEVGMGLSNLKVIDHRLWLLQFQDFINDSETSIDISEAITEKVRLHNQTRMQRKNYCRNFSKLIVTLIADLSRLESEQMSFRIKSGIQNRKEKGLTTGRKIGSKESHEKFIAKHQDILRLIKKGYSSREIQKICKCSPNTVQKVKEWYLNNTI